VADLIDLAASYGSGPARNHPFVDGNKRVTFQAMYVFFGPNGLRIEEEDCPLVLRQNALSFTCGPAQRA
jgi:death on curing protein